MNPIRPMAAIALALLTSAPIQAERLPQFNKVRVVPFQVVSRPLPGTPTRPDEAAMIARLSREATARAERTLLRQRIAVRVEPGTATPQPDSDVVLSGIVTMPVSLVPGQGGSRAMFRRGRFMTAQVTLRVPNQAPITEEVTLNWGDVWWLRGARVRRARAVDDVLVDFVRKAADHAVKRLKGPMNLASDASGTGEQP